MIGIVFVYPRKNIGSISIVCDSRKDVKAELMTFPCLSMKEEWTICCLSLGF